MELTQAARVPAPPQPPTKQQLRRRRSPEWRTRHDFSNITATAPSPRAYRRARQVSGTSSPRVSNLPRCGLTSRSHGLGLSLAPPRLRRGVGASNADWPEEFDPSCFDGRNIFSLIVYSVFGVMAVSREYSSGLSGSRSSPRQTGAACSSRNSSWWAASPWCSA